MARQGWRSVLRRGAVASSLALALDAFPMGGSQAAAQDTSLLRGVVVEESSGKLIRAAVVTLVGTETSMRTGADGTFEFANVPLGRQLVRIQADGYPSVIEEAEILPGTGNVLPVFLQSQIVALDGIIVFGRRNRALDESARTAADLLAQKYPQIKPFVNNTRPRWPSRLVLRGRGTITGGGEPLVVVDGIRMGGDAGFAISLLSQIPARDVEKLEILAGTSAAFLYGGADGAIIVETVSRSADSR